MKFRTGFVSNSSTSSFVVIGLRRTESQVQEDDDEVLYLEEEDRYLKGKALTKCDGDFIESKEYTLAQLTKIFDKVAKENGVDVSKLKLFMGTSGC